MQVCEQGRDVIWWAVGWYQRVVAQAAFHGRPLPWPQALWIVSCSPILQRGKTEARWA